MRDDQDLITYVSYYFERDMLQVHLLLMSHVYNDFLKEYYHRTNSKILGLNFHNSPNVVYKNAAVHHLTVAQRKHTEQGKSLPVKYKMKIISFSPPYVTQIKQKKLLLNWFNPVNQYNAFIFSNEQ